MAIYIGIDMGQGWAAIAANHIPLVVQAENFLFRKDQNAWIMNELCNAYGLDKQLRSGAELVVAVSDDTDMGGHMIKELFATNHWLASFVCTNDQLGLFMCWRNQLIHKLVAKERPPVVGHCKYALHEIHCKAGRVDEHAILGFFKDDHHKYHLLRFNADEEDCPESYRANNDEAFHARLWCHVAKCVHTGVWPNPDDPEDDGIKKAKFTLKKMGMLTDPDN